MILLRYILVYLTSMSLVVQATPYRTLAGENNQMLVSLANGPLRNSHAMDLWLKNFPKKYNQEQQFLLKKFNFLKGKKLKNLQIKAINDWIEIHHGTTKTKAQIDYNNSKIFINGKNLGTLSRMTFLEFLTRSEKILQSSKRYSIFDNIPMIDPVPKADAMEMAVFAAILSVGALGYMIYTLGEPYICNRPDPSGCKISETEKLKKLWKYSTDKSLEVFDCPKDGQLKSVQIAEKNRSGDAYNSIKMSLTWENKRVTKIERYDSNRLVCSWDGERKKGADRYKLKFQASPNLCGGEGVFSTIESRGFFKANAGDMPPSKQYSFKNYRACCLDYASCGSELLQHARRQSPGDKKENAKEKYTNE